MADLISYYGKKYGFIVYPTSIICTQVSFNCIVVCIKSCKSVSFARSNFWCQDVFEPTVIRTKLLANCMVFFIKFWVPYLPVD